MSWWFRDRRERSQHNDLDFECIFWDGQARKSMASVCIVCNPEGDDRPALVESPWDATRGAVTWK